MKTYFVTKLKGYAMAHLPLTRPHQASLSTAVAACAPKVQLTLLQRIVGVWRQRQHLSRLDDHMRRDIGLSDTQISHEVQRPIWDVPQTWRH
ncbi:DUF1127 domain-containing protein [Jannaschia sp. CCS1]|uniref:DUF1127 domain-containing protein n=1 Tax=Jannaschia sp. (strain CCS1) TaxID=290400 RepID=UPI00140F4EC6|nr:DUF1127 domain-containing protein [Jannaschia sp. CCS1]